MHSLLNNGGILLVNIISAIEGDNGMFLRAAYATYKSVFPQVLIFPVSDPSDGTTIQNIMLVALKSEQKPPARNGNPELNEYLSHQWKNDIVMDMPILTDDLAPVDSYIIEMMRNKQ
jgi:hypothetical protein